LLNIWLESYRVAEYSPGKPGVLPCCHDMDLATEKPGQSLLELVQMVECFESADLWVKVNN
jgi:hypothetical protein